MSRKTVIIILGVFLIVLGAYAFSPLLYDKKVNESLEEISQVSNQSDQQADQPVENDINLANDNNAGPVVLKEGEFEGVAGHSGKGTAKIIKSGDQYFLRFEDDFEATNGPDLYVYLGNNNKFDPETEIGRLKGNVGGQNYEIPSNIDISKYSEAWIWCKAFSVDFAKAELK